MKLPEFSVKKKVTTSMMAMILVVLGVISFTRLGLDFFPDLEFPTVSVITSYAGASSEDIENVLTRPLEQLVSSVNRVKKVTSQTSEGVSVISVEFEWGTNLDFAAQDIRDQIGLYKQYLPEEADEPLVMKFSFSQFPVIFYGITSDLPPMKLKTIMEDEIAPRLERIDGVASARVFSMDEREILVNIDRAALESRNLTLDQVRLALGAENLNLPAGNLVERYTEVLVRSMGEFKDLDDIRRTVIGMTAAGEPVYISDVADVKDTLRDVRYTARIQGQNGVYLIVSKRSGANTQIASKKVKAEVKKLVKTVPGNPAFHVAMDQGDMIEQVTSNTVSNAWQGGLLAILLIFLFLRNWRPTFVIGLAIPLSIITTFIALYAAGYTLNLLTLGGLALGIGMLVDNAIVVIENVYRHLEEGQSADQASISGAAEVGMAITASTLTTIAVFFPMIFASGITGKLTQALGLSIAFSLLASLFVALTVVPLSTSLLFRSEKSLKAIVKAPEERQFAKAKAWYRKRLDWALHHRRWVLGGALLAFALSMAIVPFLPTEFIPAQDRDMILLKVRMPVGTALEETDRVVGLVENIMAKMPEITMISAQTGSQAEQDASDAASSFSNSGTHEGILWVGLVKRDQRKESDQQLLERIRKQLPNLRGVKFEAIDMSQQLMGGSAAPVEIKLFGQDLPALKGQADQIVQLISGIEGIRDLTHTLVAGKPEVQIKIDRERTYRLGLSVYQVANTVQTATLGKVATRYREGTDEIDVRLRFKEQYRDSLDEVRSIPLRTASGRTVYLEQLADISDGTGPLKIDRENQARRVSITANIAGRDLGSVVKDIKARLAGFERTLPPGYFIEYGGSYEDMQDAFVILAAAFALAALLVYMVMASQFEHFVHPFIIMFTVPLGVIGVIVGLLVTGKTLNMAVLVGVILLMGIAVNNGIVMIDYINQLINRGVDKREAILQGSTTRLRAVLLTALTTVLGALPMAFSTSSGSEFRAPLGIAIAFGLTATTVLTLFVIPVIYSVVNKIHFKERKPAGV
ncbi:MAG TPA: efflux RND transporter permease subunit [Candidatus Aminicenantes bacterium]|nr:efflux RND transporter permease subunit [Candidatus Aminicenantes bacterium]HRY63979.1 efflux RND transporter permease subunit [Candidatus Aminicenantes bacterium]HRZ70892.1 efflux RND transporter permease subunit [Candidatus Aminicenantes bacterium]